MISPVKTGRISQLFWGHLGPSSLLWNRQCAWKILRVSSSSLWHHTSPGILRYHNFMYLNHSQSSLHVASSMRSAAVYLGFRLTAHANASNEFRALKPTGISCRPSLLDREEGWTVGFQMATLDGGQLPKCGGKAAARLRAASSEAMGIWVGHGQHQSKPHKNPMKIFQWYPFLRDNYMVIFPSKMPGPVDLQHLASMGYSTLHYPMAQRPIIMVLE